MRFHLVEHDSKPHILDTMSNKVYGPYDETRVISAMSYAIERSGITHKKPTALKPADCRTIDVKRYNEYLKAALPEDKINLIPVMRQEDPLPGWMVRWARGKLGLSQGELAEKLGCGGDDSKAKYRIVQSWERGERNCTGSSRLAIIEMTDA